MVTGLHQVWVIGAAWNADCDVVVGQGDLGMFGDELAEQGARFGDFESVPDAQSQPPIQHARDQRQLDIDIDFHGYRRTEGIHVKEVDGIADDVFDDHAACVAVHEFGGRDRLLVGDQNGGLEMAQTLDQNLPDRSGIGLQLRLFVHDAGLPIFAADVVEGDFAPLAFGNGVDVLHQAGVPSPERDEVDVQVVKHGQLLIGGEAAVEDEFLGPVAGARLPELYKSHRRLILRLFAHGGVGIRKDSGVRISGQDRQNAPLPTTALGDEVFLEQGFVAVIGDGVKVQIERPTVSQALVESDHGMMPPVHERVGEVRITTSGVLGQGGPFGDDVETGKEGQSRIQGLGHDLRRSADAPELQSQ